MPPKAAAPAAKPAAAKPAASKAAAPKAAAGGKPAAAAAGTAKKAPAAKSGAAKADPAKAKAAVSPEKEAEAEEQAYLEKLKEEPVQDPWKPYKSIYGGPLSAAECYDRFRKGVAGDEKLKDLQQVLVVHKAEMQSAIDALDPQPKSKAVGTISALTSLLASKGESSHQRIALSGCGLSSLMWCGPAAGRFVELDVSFNDISSVDRIWTPIMPEDEDAPKPHCWLRSLVLAGNQLTRFPCFATELPKLVKLDLSFNEIAALPTEEALANLSNLRSLGLQNCMLKSTSAPNGGCCLAPLQNLAALDLSFNLLADLKDMAGLTVLQRLQELDVGCNELCAIEGYDDTVKALRMKISTLKKLNDEEVRRQFGGYGLSGMEDMVSSIADAMTSDKSSCSCVEGNPCLQPDNCNDWQNRFRVAHKVRREMYWNKGRNFDG
uniref:Uncharacterized protein n=1 Tax=Hemiselmis andersenii TaxID=464988 RepID=A0A6T8J270_HEMAN|mmetsp:Transcript_22473/g.54712  ORF Transcript_22473/g.54712 Transcript_22473/m.54712 type:complete len:435 (+) Transcript_22473:87-1391(+)